MLAVMSFAVLLAAGPAVVEPANIEGAFQVLKDAVAQKDFTQIKNLATQTHAMASDIIASPAPATDEEKALWDTHVKFAHEVDLYTEYALYSAAIQSKPAITADLLATLEQQNPKSQYLADAYGVYFYALRQNGAAAKIPAVAEKAIVHFPDNDDALLVLAESAYGRKQADRALAYAKRLAAVAARHPKPEGMSAADWERKRDTELASGYWIAGVTQAEKNQFFEADKDLRAALPLVAANEPRKATALFYLGLANYQLGKMTMKKSLVLEGVKFSQQAASITGPLAQQAWHNAMVMKDEAAKMR